MDRSVAAAPAGLRIFSRMPKPTCWPDGVAATLCARPSQRGVLPGSGCLPCGAAEAGNVTAAIPSAVAAASPAPRNLKRTDSVIDPPIRMKCELSHTD
jgi:hypothetical protein